MESGLNESDIAQVCWCLWQIWKGRNDLVFNQIKLNPCEVIEYTKKLNSEFFEAIGYNQIPSPHPGTPLQIWTRPPMGFLKINTDGAFSNTTQYAAIGIICRDEFGAFQWGFIDKIKSLSAFMTEALALKRAMLLATDLGHNKIQFESDCQTLVTCIHSQQPDLYDWKCRAIIQDIINFVESNVGFSVHFSPRHGNAGANCLAAEAFKEVCPLGWVSQPSLSLLNILTDDFQKSCDTFPSTSSQRRGVG